MSFIRAIASEFQKVFTTRMWWLLAILLAAYVAFLSGGLGAFLGWVTTDPDAPVASGGFNGPPPGTDLATLLYSFASSVGYVFPVLLGTLAVTGEFRHRTLTPTFLAEPHRSSVLSAKFLSQLVTTSPGSTPRSTPAIRGHWSVAASSRWRCGGRSASASACS